MRRQGSLCYGWRMGFGLHTRKRLLTSRNLRCTSACLGAGRWRTEVIAMSCSNIFQTINIVADNRYHFRQSISFQAIDTVADNWYRFRFAHLVWNDIALISFQTKKCEAEGWRIDALSDWYYRFWSSEGPIMVCLRARSQCFASRHERQRSQHRYRGIVPAADLVGCCCIHPGSVCVHEMRIGFSQVAQLLFKSAFTCL